MAASDHLSPGQFYHGTRYDFAPGTELTPEGIPHAARDRGQFNGPTHVYATTNHEAAEHFARNKPGPGMPTVYHVEPLSDDVTQMSGSQLYHSSTGFRVLGRA